MAPRSALRRHRRPAHRRRPLRGVRRAARARGRRASAACARRSRSSGASRRTPTRCAAPTTSSSPCASRSTAGRSCSRTPSRRRGALQRARRHGQRGRAAADARRRGRRSSIGPETARQLEACFELEELGDGRARRAWSGPCETFRVTGERGPAHIRRQVAAGRRASPSSTVLTTPATPWPRAAAPSSPSRGEPGIGKTRLLAEARRRTGDRVCFLEGRATSYSQGSPYWPDPRPAPRLARHRAPTPRRPACAWS